LKNGLRWWVFLAPSGCPTQGVGVTREWGAPGCKPGTSDTQWDSERIFQQNHGNRGYDLCSRRERT
jgi:hypothetical protein